MRTGSRVAIFGNESYTFIETEASGENKMSCITDRKHQSVYTESEFAPLKRVILSQSEQAPSQKSDSGMGILSILMERERANLKTLLEYYGAEVIMPRRLTGYEKEAASSPDGPTNGGGMTNFYSRDPFAVIGDNIIELNLRSRERRYEVLTARDILAAESVKNNCRYVSMPRIDISQGTDGGPGPFLEGGDILLLGKTVYVGQSDWGSNENGFQWLKSYLSTFGYQCRAVRIQGNIAHLDCVISLVRDGLMIVCEDCLPDGLPEEFASWDKILVPSEAADRLAVNGLSINEEVYVTDTAFRETVGKELEKRGIHVEYLDFRITRTFKGSFRCSTNPLLRG